MSAFTFQASQKYWLLVDASAGNFSWLNTSNQPTGVATFGSSLTSLNNGATYSAGGLSNFNIDVTRAKPVPEPSTGLPIGMLVFAGLWSLNKRRKGRLVITK